MRKPKPKAFKKSLDLAGAKTNEAMFIDDRKKNVDAANELGIRSFLYTSLEQLKQDLKKSGIFAD